MAKVTIGGLRRIIREELEKVIRENEDDFGSDEETDALIGTRVEIDEDGYISPYGADFGPTKFGPSMMFEPGDEVELVSFVESGSGAWVVRGPDGEEETLKATMGGGSNKGMSFDSNHFEQTPLKKWYELNNNHFNFNYHHEDEIKNNPDMLDNEEYEGLGDYADEIVIDGRMRGGGTYGYHDKEQDAVYLLHPSRGYVKMTDPNVHNWPTLDDEEDENDPRWPGESEETRWKF